MANEKRLIDANTVVEGLTKFTPNGWGKDVPYIRSQWAMAVKINDNFMKVIAEAPTVDAVEVVHGEWLDGFAVRNGEEVCKSIVCSNCEGVFNVKTFDEQAHYKEVFEWCPFCGARMKDGDGNDL